MEPTDDDLTNYFDAVYVVNLDRRPDRMRQFRDGLPSDWPFREPQRVQAIDGKKVHAPEFWKPGGGAWGCYRTHVRLIEDGLNNGLRRILLLEDDATFVDGFTAKVRQFLAAIPRDEWDMLYLGGQHLKEKKAVPTRINEHVYQPFNVNRTHAFAVDLERFGRPLYRWLHRWNDWRPNHHIDHHLGRLHEKRDSRVYCPADWLVGQGASKSNINGRVFENDRFWRPAAKASRHHVSHEPFFAILGLHSSGSSALAGVCYHLGMHLGNKLIGYYGKNPDTSCGFEAVGLAKICEEIARLGDTERRLPPHRITEKLRWFANQKRREARKHGTVAGGKYPQLCVCGDELQTVLGDRLRVIVADRPIEESIASIQRRQNKPGDAALDAHQRWLDAEKERLIASLPPESVLRVQYDDLLHRTSDVIDRILDFTGLVADQGKIAKALRYVDPGKRHVQLHDEPETVA